MADANLRHGQANPYAEAVDRSLLRENLKLTPDARLKKFVSFVRFATELKEKGKTATARKGVLLPTLIEIKTAAGRPKDHQAIAELQVLLQESAKQRS